MKTYDKVKWDSLFQAMLKMDYSISWVERIKRFVSTVKYDVKLNGSKS